MTEANGFRYFDGFRYFESVLAGQLVLKCLNRREGVLVVSYIVHCGRADPAIAVHPHQEAGGRVVAMAVAALAPANKFLITDYPQPSKLSTNHEHSIVSAGLNDGTEQSPVSKRPQ